MERLGFAFVGFVLGGLLVAVIALWGQVEQRKVVAYQAGQVAIMEAVCPGVVQAAIQRQLPPAASKK